MKQVCLLILCICSLPLFSKEIPPEIDSPKNMELPLLDEPFNFVHGYRWPSMEQSVAVSNAFYQMTAWGIEKALRPVNRWAWRFGVIGFDVLSFYLPLGNAWMHEEWHRSILGRRGISSYNDIYNFPLFSSAVAVSHVKDEDLINLKREFPAEQVRLQSAGIEAQYEQNFRIEQNHFFFDDTTYQTPLLWFNAVNNSGYLLTCSTDSSITFTESQTNSDGSDIDKRDFTGLDCVGWTYDLFRPNEPYTSRGPHPSGIGINRYRTVRDLNDEENNYLRNQFYFSLLNFLDPFLIGFGGFHGTSPITKEAFYWNVNLRHVQTSFGFAFEQNLFWQEKETNLLFILHEYFNKNQFYPGLEARLLKQRFSFLPSSDSVTLRLLAFFQPEDQSFYSKVYLPGGLASIRYFHGFTSFLEGFLEVEGKSKGWVMGNAFLNESLAIRAGLVIPTF